MREEILSYFFKNGKLIRLTTDPSPLAHLDKRAIKFYYQMTLCNNMREYLMVKPEATLTELAYAYHDKLLAPPECKTCGKMTKFGRGEWNKFCNAKCQLLNDEFKAIRTIKALEKWGVKHQFLKENVIKAKREKSQTGLREKQHMRQEKRIKRAETKVAKIQLLEDQRNNVRAQKRSLMPEFSNFEFGKSGKILKAMHSCGEIIISPRLPAMCYKCHAPAKESAQWHFTRLVNKDFIRNKRICNGKFQLDAYWPEEHIALEYNGLYWHSSAPKPGSGRTLDKFYHQEKMLAAKAEGIRLITIWEDEARSSTFKEHIGSLFTKNKIYARQCIYAPITSQESQNFLKINHRDSYARGASYHVGLFFNKKLVMVATIGRNRFGKGGLELYRLASEINTQIVGGVSKIIKNFMVDKNNDLITYSTATWGWGSAYEKSGFKLEQLTAPGYFYFNQKSGTRLHRLALSKSNFEKTTGEPWDAALSEEDNAARVKCWRVWDCGNWKFKWNKPEDGQIIRLDLI